MLKPHQKLQLIIGLIEVNDQDLIESDHVLAAAGFVPDEYQLVRSIRDKIIRLIENFSYAESPEFLRNIEGCSPAYRERAIKLNREPAKRKEHRDRYIAALDELPAIEGIADLTQESSHNLLVEVAGLVYSLVHDGLDYEFHRTL